MCESKAPLRGWRVPVGCQLTAQGQYLEACFLAESSWPLVAEFFRSRYPATQVVVSGLQVRAPTAPPAWKLNPGVVLPEGAPVPKPPAPTGPSLSVRRKANGVELVAVGAVAPLTQR